MSGLYEKRRGYPGRLAYCVADAIEQVSRVCPKPDHMTWDQWMSIVLGAAQEASACIRRSKRRRATGSRRSRAVVGW